MQGTAQVWNRPTDTRAAVVTGGGRAPRASLGPRSPHRNTELAGDSEGLDGPDQRTDGGTREGGSGPTVRPPEPGETCGEAAGHRSRQALGATEVAGTEQW